MSSELNYVVHEDIKPPHCSHRVGHSFDPLHRPIREQRLRFGERRMSGDEQITGMARHVDLCRDISLDNLTQVPASELECLLCKRDRNTSLVISPHNSKDVFCNILRNVILGTKQRYAALEESVNECTLG
ncbi:unnamed protein product [Leptosia nina]|uniref:Uncharacterized protein n=1 Tax=Leptosia nina TaxID=320188 RepID=A0AAV1JQS5_9NEOP